MTTALVEPTGPTLRAPESALAFDDKPKTDAAEAPMEEGFVERARKQRRQVGRETQQRVALLGLIMSHLVEVELDTAAELLGVKPPRLLKLLHGDEQVPRSFDAPWSDIAEVLANLRTVLADEYIESWLKTPAPDLDGRSPLWAMTRSREKDRKRVVAISRRFTTPSFS